METVEGPRAEAGGAWSTHLGSASPCRFWASVEPYCADITSEEVRTLEELLKPPEDEAEHYKIPPLGKHYSQRWAQEDLLEEQKDGARAAAVADKKKGLMGPLTELDTKGKVPHLPAYPRLGLKLPELQPSFPSLLCRLQMWMPC